MLLKSISDLSQYSSTIIQNEVGKIQLKPETSEIKKKKVCQLFVSATQQDDGYLLVEENISYRNDEVINSDLTSKDF